MAVLGANRDDRALGVYAHRVLGGKRDSWRRKCPFTLRTRLIPGPANATRTIRLTSVQRRHRSGATLRLYVVKNGFYGKYTGFGIRRGKAPRRFDRCVKSIILKPVRCPGD